MENIEEQQQLPIKEQIFELVNVIKKSSYVLLLLPVMIFAQMLTTLLEYQYMDIFSTNTTEAELAVLFGQLFIGVNLFNLIISLFIFNRLALRIGVRNLAILQPIIYSIAFTYLFMGYGFGAALFGFFAYQGMMVAIDYDNTNLLLNALPAEAQTKVRTFIEGLAEPFATAIAGVFLLLFAPMLDTSTLSLIGIGTALVYLILVFLVRNEYINAMVTNLKKGWLDFSKSTKKVMKNLNNEQIHFLMTQTKNKNTDTVLTAIYLLFARVMVS